MRDMTNARPSKVSSSPAMTPISVERPSRRASRIVAATSSAPNTQAMNRQPNELTPNRASPAAISHLPSWGCTTKDAPCSR